MKLRAQFGRVSSTVASKHKSAARARAQVASSKPASTVQSKTREAESHEAAMLASEKKRADLEEEAADMERLGFRAAQMGKPGIDPEEGAQRLKEQAYKAAKAPMGHRRFP